MKIAHELASLDLNLLVPLDALLTERSVTRAALRVRISQSAMSHKLRALRELLGDELLVGPRGRQVLTDRAHEIERPLRQALAALAAAIQPLEPFVPATSTRTFRVATGDVGEIVVLPDALHELHKEAPGVKLDFLPVDGALRQRLEDGDVDFVVGSKIPPFPGLMQKTICHEPVVIVLRHGHPAAHRMTMQRYLDLEHIAVSSGSIVDAELARQGTPRKVHVRLTSLVVGVHLACRSDLALTTGLTFAAASTRDLRAELVSHPSISLKIPLVLSWHERSNQDPGAVWARAFADRVTRRVVEEGMKLLRAPARGARGRRIRAAAERA